MYCDICEIQYNDKYKCCPLCEKSINRLSEEDMKLLQTNSGIHQLVQSFKNNTCFDFYRHVAEFKKFLDNQFYFSIRVFDDCSGESFSTIYDIRKITVQNIISELYDYCNEEHKDRFLQHMFNYNEIPQLLKEKVKTIKLVFFPLLRPLNLHHKGMYQERISYHFCLLSDFIELPFIKNKKLMYEEGQGGLLLNTSEHEMNEHKNWYHLYPSYELHMWFINELKDFCLKVSVNKFVKVVTQCDTQGETNDANQVEWNELIQVLHE